MDINELHAKGYPLIDVLFRHFRIRKFNFSPKLTNQNYVNIFKKFLTKEYNSEIRALSRAYDVKLFLNSIDPVTLTNYLDLGAGDASVTKAVFELLPLKDVYAVDIKIPDKIYIPKSQYIKTDGKNIKLNCKIDLITCFQSLHHMRHIDDIFRSLMKYVQPGCLLFIREHDVENETQKVLIEFDHFIYETVYEDKPANNWKQYSHYRSAQEWDEFLLSYGFKKIFYKKKQDNYNKIFIAGYILNSLNSLNSTNSTN